MHLHYLFHHFIFDGTVQCFADMRRCRVTKSEEKCFYCEPQNFLKNHFSHKGFFLSDYDYPQTINNPVRYSNRRTIMYGPVYCLIQQRNPVQQHKYLTKHAPIQFVMSVVKLSSFRVHLVFMGIIHYIQIYSPTDADKKERNVLIILCEAV